MFLHVFIQTKLGQYFPSKKASTNVTNNAWFSVRGFDEKTRQKETLKTPKEPGAGDYCLKLVRAYAGKTRWIVYRHQQVEMTKCRSDICEKKLFFKNHLFSC